MIISKPDCIELNSSETDVHITVQSGIKATIIETGHHQSVQVEVGENASVQYIAVFSGEGETTKWATLRAHASIHWRTALLGGNTTHDISTRHLGNGATSDHQGIFLGRNNDRFIMNYWSEHIGQHTSGHIVIHGTLFDSSYADFKGNIKIARSAVHTDGSLTEETLLLGEHARSDSVPQLEIDTNDVQAAHSSAISRIDDEQLFYLQSRMIPKAEAKRMIVRGFLEGIIHEFNNETVQRQINGIIEERLAIL